MVSIFGLKIGGDKKKRSETPKPQPSREHDHGVTQGALGASKVSLSNGGSKTFITPSSRSMPQPGASQANLLTPSAHSLQAFYNPNGPALASASMNDLTRTTSNNEPRLQALKPAVSNPHLGTRWHNGSSPNLAVSPQTIPRPATSGRQKGWVEPLDVHFAKAQFTPSLVKSPLSISPVQPFNTDAESRVALQDESGFRPLPKALNIVKSPAPAIPPRSALRHPPSPPPSIKTQSEKASSEIDRFSILERPIPVTAGESRPSSRGSHRNVPTSLRELMAADDLIPNSSVSCPTPPPSLPRASNEAGNRASMNEFGEPIIQTVRAKRETMTISAARKRSLEKMIDSMLPPQAARDGGRPRTSSGPRVQRPMPLKLNIDTQNLDKHGLKSAPFAARQRSESPFARRPQRPARTGVPAAAVGALGRPSRPSRQGVHRPTADEYCIGPARPAEDKFEYASPPDSPIMPLDGPLASLEPPDSPIMPLNGPLSSLEPPDSPIMPMEGPLSAFESPISPVIPVYDRLDSPEPPDSPIMPTDGPLASLEPPDSPILPVRGPLASSIDLAEDQFDTNFRFPDWSIASDSRSGSAASVFQPLALDELPSAQSVDWPLPAPSVVGPDSPSLLVRAQSPFAIPSFSRPWTPTNVRPGTPTNARTATPTTLRSATSTNLRSLTPTDPRSTTPTNLRSVTPVKTTELAIRHGLRGLSPSPRAPPPRIMPEYALKNAPIVAVTEHAGAGFI